MTGVKEHNAAPATRTTTKSLDYRGGTALIASFSLLLILMTAITLVGLSYMETTKERLNDIVDQRMSKLSLSTEMRIAARERTASLQRMTLLRDPFERDEQWMVFNGQAGVFIDARQKMTQLPLSNEERELLKQQGLRTAVAVPLQNRVVDLIKSDRIDEAQYLLVTQAIPAQDEVLKQLEHLQLLQAEASSAALAQADIEYTSARRWMIGLSASVLGLGMLIAIAVVYRSLSATRALKQASDALQYRATHDGLTGLLNRLEFDRRLEQVLQEARERNGQHVVCYLDIDLFKPINDAVGHVGGDELLRQLADHLRSRVRPTDLAARVGGDEFAIVFVNCSLTDGTRRAEDIRRAVHKLRFAWGTNSYSISASVGVAQIGANSGTATDVLSLADDACRNAKLQGRNRVHLGGGSEDLSAKRADILWVNRIRDAMARGQLVLHGQVVQPIGPQVAPLHFEIMVRMQESDGELVPPGSFLPIAERYHMMPEVDRAVVRASLAELARYREERGVTVLANINLSGQSLYDPEFGAFVIQAIRESGVPPEWLCFEITETAAISNFSSAIELVASLRALGCLFALDDFGSGVSSFGYLKTLKVDFVKIDGAFVKNIADDRIDRAMVRSINEMAHVIGIRTIAEYVESEAILEELERIGVDFAQGFAISTPQPLAAVLRASAVPLTALSN